MSSKMGDHSFTKIEHANHLLLVGITFSILILFSSVLAIRCSEPNQPRSGRERPALLHLPPPFPPQPRC